ncbi:MAG: HAD family hydrolase [Gemmatimonadetes bacterium]|jgi:FMN phosphatase YigB (HAD superfamily)|nr:HAD family hydrolase [Gemmatimonadota bacterium]
MSSRLHGVEWIFFDLGSTLLDETKCLMDRLSKAATLAGDFGVYVTLEELWRWSEEAYTAFEPSPFRSALAHTNLTEEHREVVYQGSPYHNSGEILYSGVGDLLAQLSASYHLGIIANQPPGLQQRLAAYGIVEHFRCILGSGDMEVGKPNPAIFELAEREVAPCTPDRMVMVGDRVDNDIRPANELGWCTVRVRQGIAHRQVPRKPAEIAHGELENITHLRELLELQGK